MDAPTIKQIVDSSPSNETLWHYIAAFPDSMEFQIIVALMISGVVGIFSHYVFKWLSGDIEGGLLDYLFCQYPKRTALSFCGYIGWACGLVGTGLFITSSGQFVGWGLVIIIGLTNGFGADSLANKSNKPQQ